MNDIENLKSNEIEEILTNLIFDLILISSAKFNKLAITELPLKTPFVCVCNKELWLMIQLMIEKYHYDGIEMNKFWFYFNNVVKSYRERKGWCECNFKVAFNTFVIFRSIYKQSKQCDT